MPESRVENLLTDAGIGKLASLMKWLIATIIAFALIASGTAINVSNQLTALSILTQGQETRLSRLERQQDK